ncbi:MAG: glutamine amidotransferase [Coriobacteriales bacterium]|nr:glutamine amidotransferase [Coriobacteriales bacterium]
MKIVNLYPRQMNIYGDYGNLLVLLQRAGWRGIQAEAVDFNLGDDKRLVQDVDIILGGGGQDSGQAAVQEDLQRIAQPLQEAIDDGCPALVVCGMYQLFGNYFKTFEGDVIEGIGIFNMHTLGGHRRMIGNAVIETNDFGELIGYENHSGKTYLGSGTRPLGKVTVGDGNNGQDGFEGARVKNALGTYLHGPLLPKNPLVADFLIAQALERKSGYPAKLAQLDDSLVVPARKAAKARPR